jgi:hypothetical protein
LKTLIQVGDNQTPDALEYSGLKILVEISTSTFDVEKGKETRKSIKVWAKIDTAAYKTHLSQKITDFLDLKLKGEKYNVPTGGGFTKTKTFAIDLNFVDYPLDPFINLEVESMPKFPFDLSNNIEKRNIGVLIGRDILSNWNLNWDGPTSTVTIFD